MNTTNKTKCVFSPQLAQYLLQCGFQIVDIKPNRNAPRETVFVFARTKGFDEQWRI
jgi:hypothetical protein